MLSSAQRRKRSLGGATPVTSPSRPPLTASIGPTARITKRVGWKAGEIRHRIFRHTYTATRLQTLDRGAPVSLYTVSDELGHGSEDMVRRVYAHLGTVRHRSEVLEYRVEQHFDRLGDQLVRLGYDELVS